jgi:hypothetical protein
MSTYSLFLQNYLDSVRGCYKKIITIDRMPTGPLANITRRIQNPPLSPFSRSFDSCSTRNSCIYAIKNPDNRNELMMAEDIPILYTFLATNGYNIMSQLTQMTTNTNVRFDNTLITFISY